jgi:hypothetical protein
MLLWKKETDLRRDSLLRMEACGEEPKAIAPKNGELRQRAGEREREYERRLFTEALRLDLREFFPCI